MDVVRAAEKKKSVIAEVGAITWRIVLESFGRGRHAHVRDRTYCAGYTKKNMVARARLHFPARQPVEQGERADARRAVLVEQIGQLGATRPRRAE